MENPPNQTLYINNLNEKVKKEGKLMGKVLVACLVSSLLKFMIVL